MKLDLIPGNFSSPSYIAHGASNSISWSLLALNMLVAGYLLGLHSRQQEKMRAIGSKALSCRGTHPSQGRGESRTGPQPLGHVKLMAGEWARLNF